jgi:hypothetical protein
MRPSSRKISRSEVIMSSEDAAKREAAEVPVVQPEPGTESSNPSPSASESVTRRFRGWGEKARLSPERAHGTGSEKGTWWRRTGVFGPYFSGRALMQSPLGIRGVAGKRWPPWSGGLGSLALSRVASAREQALRSACSGGASHPRAWNDQRKESLSWRRGRDDPIGKPKSRSSRSRKRKRL